MTKSVEIISGKKLKVPCDIKATRIAGFPKPNTLHFILTVTKEDILFFIKNLDMPC